MSEVKTKEPEKTKNANNVVKGENGATKMKISKNGEKKGGKRLRRAPQKVREYDQRVLDVRRVTRVVAGGRRFSLSAVVVIGNRKGAVGIGVGKSTDVAEAVKKAVSNAKKHLKNIPLTENLSIPHEVVGKYCASRVILFPATTGVVAGGAVRVVADLAGIRNINGKILTRSKNHLNNAQATLNALRNLRVRKNKNIESTAKASAESKAKKDKK